MVADWIIENTLDDRGWGHTWPFGPLSGAVGVIATLKGIGPFAPFI